MKSNTTKPLLLFTQQLLDAYWPQVEPLLATAPVAEEFPPSAIYNAVLSGQMLMFVFTKETFDGPEVELVLVMASTPSETFPVLTLVTVAGKNLRTAIKAHWENFKGWCAMNGARAIDAYVPERMEHLMEKELGLKKETSHVRLRL